MISSQGKMNQPCFLQFRRKCFLFQCTTILSRIVAKPGGLTMVLRLLLEGAIMTPFAKIFGGKFSSGETSNSAKGKRLFEENLKFGSMPTQPLGTSTVFHAGIIGSGKRATPSEGRLPEEDIQTNIFLFVSVLFKLCHCPERIRETNPRLAEIERRKLSKEACEQLALLMVDLVSRTS